MPSRNTIEIIINAKDNASQVIGKLADNTQSIGAIATGAIVAGFGAATIAVAGFASKGISEFMKFEQGMQEVFSLLPGISQTAMDSMTEQVEYMSQVFGVLPEQTIPALYEALSAGIPQDNVFNFLEVANKAAIAGVTDLETAVNGISSAMNAYGHDVLDAGKASDIMFQTVKLGKTTFEELSNSLYNVSPTAAALGVTFDDLNAQIAAITAQGTPTSVATNQMRAMFVELSKAGGETAETFEQLAGKTFKQFIAEGGNTQDALQLLEQYAQETGVGINDLFSSVEAGSAALSLTGRNTERFTNFLGQMAEAAGSTDAAFETMSKSLQFQVNRLNAKMSVLYKTIGEKLAPVVAPLVEGFGDIVSIIIDLVDGTTDWTDAIQEQNPFLRKIMETVLKLGLAIRGVVYNVLEFIGAIRAGVDPLNAFFSLLMDFGLSTNAGLAIMGLIDAFADLKGILEFIITPIKAFIRDNVKLQDVIVALGFAIATFVIPAVASLVIATAPLLITFGLLVAGAVLLRKAWEKNFLDIRNKVSKAVTWIETKLTDLRAALWNVLGDPGDDPISAALKYLAENPFIKSLIDNFNRVKEALTPLFREIREALSQIDFSQLFEVGSTLLSLTSPLGILKTLFETIFNVNIFDIFIDGINKVTEILANLNAGMGLKEALGIEEGSDIAKIIDMITNAFNGVVTFIQEQAIPALQRFGVWFLSEALPGIVHFIVGTVVPAIGEFIGWLIRVWTDVSPFLTELVNWFINDALPKVVQFINDVVIPVIQDVIKWISDLWLGVQPHLEDLYNWFVNEALPAIISFLNDTVIPAIGDFIQVLKNIWDEVSPVISQLVDWFVTTGLPLIRDFLVNVIIPAVGDFIQVLKDIWTTAQPFIEQLKSGLSAAFNWIKTNVIDPIVARINDFINLLVSLGIIQANTNAVRPSLVPEYNDPGIDSRGAFGHYNGLPYAAKDMGIRIHQGERVLTKEENADYSNNQNQKPQVVIENISIGNVENQADANRKADMFIEGLRAKGIEI